MGIVGNIKRTAAQAQGMVIEARAIAERLQSQGGLMEGAEGLLLDLREKMKLVDSALTSIQHIEEVAVETMEDVGAMLRTARQTIDGMDLPATTKELTHAGLAVIDHFVRVGTRASNAAQAATKAADRVEQVLAAIHERGFRLQIPEAKP